MTKTKTLEQIQNLLIKDFGIKNISGKPVLSTTEKDTSGVLDSAPPSIYYRGEIEYDNFKNNAYIIFSISLDPEKNDDTYSYKKNTLNILNYSQNPKRSAINPQFEIELRENHIDNNFEIAYRQFHKNLENEEFEDIFLAKDLNKIRLAFSDLETILNKTKKARQNIVQQVDVEDELKTFSLDPQMFNNFNILDLQKACTLFLEARYTALNKYKDDISDIQTLKKINWSQLYNTYTTKNIAISYLNKTNFSDTIDLSDEFFLSIYFTIIKDLNEKEETIFTKTLTDLGIDPNVLEKNIYSKVFQLEEINVQRYKERKYRSTSSRRRDYRIELKSPTNPNLRKTKDALIYIEELLGLISSNENQNPIIQNQRSLSMYLRTKFARFKQDGLINSSKNGPRYILETKGQELLSK